MAFRQQRRGWHHPIGHQTRRGRPSGLLILVWLEKAENDVTVLPFACAWIAFSRGFPDRLLAVTGAALGLLLWAVGLLWHGMMGQPSFMGMMYAAPYASPMLLGGMFFGLVAGGFVLGWVGASVYNRVIGAS